MRSFSALTVIALVCAGIILCGCSEDGDPSGPGVVETQYGKVQGVVEEGYRAFLGIPFTAPPVGDLRWKSPQPHEGWSGVRDATAFGPSCPQPVYDTYGPTYDEDCLALSV
jgi:para-nitrobenzyl esterase